MCEAKLHRPLDIVKYWCRVYTPAMNFGRMRTPGTEHDWYWIWYQSLIALRLCMPEYKYNLKWRGDHVELMMGSFERHVSTATLAYGPPLTQATSLVIEYQEIDEIRDDIVCYLVLCGKAGHGLVPITRYDRNTSTYSPSATAQLVSRDDGMNMRT